MLLVEVGEHTIRRQFANLEVNNANFWVHLDILYEIQYKEHIQEYAYKQWVARRYNSQVKSRTFHPGDIVWCIIGEPQKNFMEGKLASN